MSAFSHIRSVDSPTIMTTMVGESCIVVMISVAREGRICEETQERVVAPSIGTALDAYAPNPAQGTCFAIQIEGRGCRV